VRLLRYTDFLTVAIGSEACGTRAVSVGFISWGAQVLALRARCQTFHVRGEVTPANRVDHTSRARYSPSPHPSRTFVVDSSPDHVAEDHGRPSCDVWSRAFHSAAESVTLAQRVEALAVQHLPLVFRIWRPRATAGGGLTMSTQLIYDMRPLDLLSWMALGS